MATVIVYRFQCWDITNDVWRTSERWATMKAIERIPGAEYLRGSGVEIDERYLGSELEGMSKRGFDACDPGPLPPVDPDYARLMSMRKP